MQKRGPWSIKSTEIKYKSPWIELREDQVIRPDGKDGIYATISFGADGAHVLPFDDEGNVYLIQEFAYGLGASNITVVAGRVDPGETPLEGAKRELREETGIEAKEWIPLGFANPLTSQTKLDNYFFIARGLSFGEPALEGSEAIELYKVPFAEAVAMAMDGRITSEHGCLLILKAHLYLQDTRTK